MVVIACGNQKLFENLCLKVANHPEWLSDERFASNADRMAHLDELKETIEEWSSQHPVSEIVDLLVAAGVPGGPVYDLSQVVKDEHIAGARDMFHEIYPGCWFDLALTFGGKISGQVGLHPGCEGQTFFGI